MFSFLSSFTEPFLIALLFWPISALFLTVPILAAQYRRFSKISIGRGLVAYAGMLYLLGLISFTLYPMPSNPVEFCRDYNLSPQLVPFSFLADIQADGLRAVLQIVMNLVFFLPLGVFCKLFFNVRLRTTLLFAFLTSLFIETAQLTGAFGYYPCSYRLFDADDLMVNVFGSFVGYGLASLVPHHEIARIRENHIVRNAGLVRYTTGFILDQMLAYFVTVVILLAIYTLLDKQTAIAIRDMCFFLVSLIVLNVVPLVARGWSAGGWVVRLNHDDKPRTAARRIVFYLVRAVVLMLILFPPFTNSLISLVVIALLLMVWWRRKKHVYQYV